MYWESVYAVHDGYDKGNIDYAYDKADYEDYLLPSKSDPDYTDYFYYSDFSDPDTTWKRSGEEKDVEEKVSNGYTRDWRYVLGLPPWFLKT